MAFVDFNHEANNGKECTYTVNTDHVACVTKRVIDEHPEPKEFTEIELSSGKTFNINMSYNDVMITIRNAIITERL